MSALTRARGRCRIGAALGLVCLGLVACEQGGTSRPGHSVPGGNPERGRQLVGAYGCGSCHEVPGVRGARGLVGPPLDHFDRRGYIAGRLPNEPTALQQWLMSPQRIVPGNAMPDMKVSARDARDLAAYLYTLR